MRYLSRSWAAAGGATGRARVSVWAGADEEPYDLADRTGLDHVRWHWVDRERFRRESIFATVTERQLEPSDADVVVFCDADTLLVRNVDDVLEAVASNGCVAGVIAHVPPPLAEGDVERRWEHIFASAGRRLPSDRYQHTGWGAMYDAPPANRFGPAYYNFGAVFVPGPHVARLGEEFERQIAIAGRTPIVPFFKAQLALTFAIYELDLPRVALALRYNFPNDEWAERLFPADLDDVRVVHYLREHVIGTRRSTWGDDDNFSQFLLRQDLAGSNEAVRSTCLRLA